jgi:KRAB domain-containing zinc finger protein
LTLQTSQEIMHPKAIINENKKMSKSDLNRYVESVHEESKPFKCKICDYKSATKGNLKRHIESVHEGIKPFKCTICDFKASQKRNLSKHIESKKCHRERYIVSVHERKIYACSFCEKSFSRNDYLKKHIASIHPSKSVHSISLSDITVANMYV